MVLNTEISEDKNKVLLKVKCPFCGALSEVSVPAENYRRYLDGELIQNAFPAESPETRELVLTGICLKCQEDVFCAPDDEENNF